MPDWTFHILLSISRWLHIVATTLLVGGTLFYEFVVPRAIEDLKEEHQLAVFGRVRWVFRQVVWFSAVVLVITGALSTWRHWQAYSVQYPSSKPWWVFHVGIGMIAIAIALRLTMTWRPPVRPLAWMRINMVILLVVIFLASTARHVRLALHERDEWLRPRTYPMQPHRVPPPAVDKK